MKVGIGYSMGTFGELAQGEVNGHPYLFSFPIPLQSMARFDPFASGWKCEPERKWKAAAAAEKILERLGRKKTGALTIETDILESKGMASSSADITAAIRAAASSFDIRLSAEEAARIAAEIEPTDGVMYKGITAVNQQSGKLLASFPKAPPLKLIGYDSGGAVHTGQYYRRKKQYNSAEKQQVSCNYNRMKAALSAKDVVSILEAATISARVNQRLLPKPYFHLFASLAEYFKGGVIIAHSGTVIGILLDPDDRDVHEKAWEIKQAVLAEAGWLPIVDSVFPSRFSGNSS
ncbi:GHMP family kinase ATP-binding protein [Bacillus xiapuensis]|uniref:GHMP family kinase ATP-binding protein n=1 Tax=Bacillus xiapuensis TaxID=2014075 RepID=UPI000C24A29E|nr:hypothetical protein [Bacillus xiapuensis]